MFRPGRLRPAFEGLYARRFEARIYDVTKTQSDLRVYVTDRSGTVVFDSLGRDEGRDYLRWRDVELTLKGGYGARTTLDDPANPDSAVMQLSSLEKRRGLSDVSEVELDEVLGEVMPSLAPVADARRVSVAVSGAAGVTVTGERFLLQRALTNLLQNAIDFSPEGAGVEVSVTAQPRSVEIQVRDHGPGMPDFALDRVFEKFYSLQRPHSGRKGTGLGLAFVKEIAGLHRGRAELRNHPDGGAVAILTLPRRVF
jgi:signal transduction histidine kinase